MLKELRNFIKLSDTHTVSLHLYRHLRDCWNEIFKI